MWVGRPKYSLVRSFVQGFGAARDDGVLNGFQKWLSMQEQHHAIKNFAWSALILHEVFPERGEPNTPGWADEDESRLGANWPLPPDSPISEDALAYPDEKLAVDLVLAAGIDRCRLVL